MSEGITSRSVEFGKRHWPTAVVSIIVSSVLPVLQEWHAEKATADAIDAAEKRTLVAVEQVRQELKDSDARNQASRLELKADMQRQLDALNKTRLKNLYEANSILNVK